MEDKDPINSEEIAQVDASVTTQQRGKGTDAIIEYLLAVSDSILSDEKIEGPSNEEKNAIANMVHLYLQARYEEAAAEADRCVDSNHPEISSFAVMAHSVANVALNKTSVAQQDYQALQIKAKSSENQRISALNDVYYFALSVFFHLGGETAPVPPDNRSYRPEGVRLFMLYARSYALYLQQEYAQALGVAEAALMLAGGRHELIRIYLNLAASMAAINLSRFEQADRFFLNALEIAKPNHYIQPFIGHHGPLQGLVEKHIRDREPELYKMIVEKVIRFRRGWTEIHNPQSSNKVTNLLTPYEFALAMMAAKGKTNQEIADYLHISINTVKAHLSTIYQKLCITKRSELKKCLNK
jgi:DNA-binding CsgD family transcriptional regulator